MSTVTSRSVRDHVVLPALTDMVRERLDEDDARDEYDVDAIMRELLHRFPLREWSYHSLGESHPGRGPARYWRYSHPDLDQAAFWEIAALYSETTKAGYDYTRDGLAPLALDWDLEQRLMARKDETGRMPMAVEEKINERVSAKIREHGVDYDSTWLGAWSAQDIVREVLDEAGE